MRVVASSPTGQPEPGKLLTFADDKYLNPAVASCPAPQLLGKTYGTTSQPNFTMFQLANFIS